ENLLCVRRHRIRGDAIQEWPRLSFGELILPELRWWLTERRLRAPLEEEERSGVPGDERRVVRRRNGERDDALFDAIEVDGDATRCGRSGRSRRGGRPRGSGPGLVWLRGRRITRGDPALCLIG